MEDKFSSERLKVIKDWQKRLTDKGLLPFSQLYISHKGSEIFYHQTGVRDVNTKEPITRDSYSRLYSMTKPITSVALMILLERGWVNLSDPIHLHLGEKWKKSNMKVFNASNRKHPKLDSCENDITIHMLLTHTSGLTYGFDLEGFINPLDKIYFESDLLKRDKHSREGNTSFNGHYDTLAQFVDKLSEMPLMFQPGARFNYSYGLEVVGRIVEVISGESFDKFLQQNVFDPLKMTGIGFHCKDETKMTSLYRHPFLAYPRGMTRKDLNLKSINNHGRQWTKDQTFFKPGEGLVATIDDYVKFAHMLLNKGELHGVRILSPKTVELMTMNHMRHIGSDGEIINMDVLTKMHDNSLKEGYPNGAGFGLGFSIIEDPAYARTPLSKGTFSFSGVAQTRFFVDPVEEVVIVFFTQVTQLDSILMPLASDIANVVYGAMNRSAKL